MAFGIDALIKWLKKDAGAHKNVADKFSDADIAADKARLD